MAFIIVRPIADNALRSKVQFVADLLNASGPLADKIGISPEAVTAQAALESGYGASKQGQHGLFGQKVTPDWTGLKVLCRTREFIGGEYITIDAWFRDYPSLEACLDDHFAFLNLNTRYRDAGVFDRLGDEHFFTSLQKAGYATDPNYARTLMAVEDTVTDYFMPFLGVSGAAPTPAAPRHLMVGLHGDDVKLVQSALKTLGLYRSTIDGDFGPLTFAAVTAFQKQKFLNPTGVVDDQCRQALSV